MVAQTEQNSGEVRPSSGQCWSNLADISDQVRGPPSGANFDRYRAMVGVDFGELRAEFGRTRANIARLPTSVGQFQATSAVSLLLRSPYLAAFPPSRSIHCFSAIMARRLSILRAPAPDIAPRQERELSLIDRLAALDKERDELAAQIRELAALRQRLGDEGGAVRDAPLWL